MSVKLGRFVISEPTLQKILDFLPYPFLVAEVKDGVRLNSFVNQKFLEDIGYTTDEMPTITDWFHLAYPNPIYRSMVEELWSKRKHEALQKGENAVSLQVKITNKRGIERWFEVKASIGETEMVAFIDIHEVKVREENLKKRNANRDRILSILGHDLRGPLVHMYMLSKLAVDDQISQEDFHKLIEEVNHKAFQSLEFLSTTLAWAKANFDSIALRPEHFSLATLVQEALGQYRELIAQKKLRLRISIDETISIYTDKEILNTVIRNLISNAIKFSFEQGTITIRATQTNHFTTLEIGDDGVGMEKEKIEQIKSYQQHSSIGTFGEKGLGIGLLLCHDLLQHTGSRLDVVSQVGQGTLMKIDIKPL